MSVAAVATIVGAGVAAYGAVSASDAADKNRKSLDLNTALGRKTATELAQIQHDDTNRQLSEQINEFKARAVLAAQSEQNKTNYQKDLLVIGAGLGAIWLIRKKK